MISDRLDIYRTVTTGVSVNSGNIDKTHLHANEGHIERANFLERTIWKGRTLTLMIGDKKEVLKKKSVMKFFDSLNLSQEQREMLNKKEAKASEFETLLTDYKSKFKVDGEVIKDLKQIRTKTFVEARGGSQLDESRFSYQTKEQIKKQGGVCLTKNLSSRGNSYEGIVLHDNKLYLHIPDIRNRSENEKKEIFRNLMNEAVEYLTTHEIQVSEVLLSDHGTEVEKLFQEWQRSQDEQEWQRRHNYSTLSLDDHIRQQRTLAEARFDNTHFIEDMVVKTSI